jgi:hypothetical protein
MIQYFRLDFSFIPNKLVFVDDKKFGCLLTFKSHLPTAIVEKEHNYSPLNPKSFDPQGEIADDDSLSEQFQVKMVKLDLRLC